MKYTYEPQRFFVTFHNF